MFQAAATLLTNPQYLILQLTTFDHYQRGSLVQITFIYQGRIGQPTDDLLKARNFTYPVVKMKKYGGIVYKAQVVASKEIHVLIVLYSTND